MVCQYKNKRTYYVVLTPHFQCRQKEYGLTALEKHYDAMFARSITGKLSGTGIHKCYVYWRKVYNARRKRWELEMITITPAKRFQTRNHPNTEYVHI